MNYLKDKGMLKNTFILGLILVLMVGFFVRWQLVGKQFTHCDDISVAVVLANDKWLQEDYAKNFFENPQAENYYSLHYKIFRHLKKWGLLQYTYKYISIPQRFTYAPAQFVFTAHLVDENYSYEDNILMSRLPSFIISLIAIVVFALLFYTDNTNLKIGGLFATLLLALSWENIIHACHASSYASAVLIIPLVLIVTKSYLEKRLNPYWIGLIFGLMFSFNYQTLFVLPVFYTTVALSKLDKDNYKLLKPTVIKTFVDFSIISVGFLFFYFPIHILFLKKHLGANSTVSHWNLGKNLEYIFNTDAFGGIGDKLIYFAKFYFFNSWEVFSSMVSIVPYSSAYFDYVNLLFLVLFILGLGTLIKQRNIIYLGSFFTIIAVWFVLTFLGKLTLSPTRHYLVLLPFFLIPIGYGFAFLMQKSRWFISLFGFLIIIFFLFFQPTVQQRTRLFSEQTFMDILNQHSDIDKVIGYGFTYDHYLMQGIKPIRDLLYFKFANYKSCAFWALGYPSLECMTTKTQTNKILVYSVAGPINAVQLSSILTVFPEDTKLEELTVEKVTEKTTDIEMEFSPKTHNTSANNFYCYIISKKE